MSKTKSVPRGGAATVSGIIYQMLWSLLETFALHVEKCDANATGTKASQAFLILEPHGGGGDLLVVDRDIETVQQLKSRSGGGAWSLHDIVHDVLPDLYRAVREYHAQKFVFITEGHIGQWKEVYDLFQRMKLLPMPSDEYDTNNFLDASRLVSFGGALTSGASTTTTLSESQLFFQIVDILRESGATKNDDPALIYRKLWKLLANFEFRGDETSQKLHAQLRRSLRAVVNDTDQIDLTLNALLTTLAKEAKKGHARIEAEGFLKALGLTALPLTSWHKLVERSATLVDERLPIFRYQPNEDVRPSVDSEKMKPWQRGDARFLVLAGESGQGKTWQFLSLARRLAQDVPVTVLEATGSGVRDKEEAARILWQSIAGHDGPRDLEQIARRVQETVPQQAGCWLFVFVDNVLSTAEADEIRRAFFSVTGVRVAFTAPPEVAERFANTFDNEVQFIRVSDFTEEELRQYVAGGDAQAWHDIPQDIRAVIRRPLLANIYRQLTQGGQSHLLNTEYQLYASYYQKRLVNPLQSEIPAAFLGLRKAALAVWQGKSYPWNLHQLEEYGLTDTPTFQILIKIGWLRPDTHQSYRIWHDRLLNWQVAEVLAQEIESGRQEAAAFGERCATDFHHIPAGGEAHHLGYVLMDVVWLLAQRGAAAIDALCALFAPMENDLRTVRIFYEDLVPTIGEAIVPALFQRLQICCEESTHTSDMTAGHIASALEKIKANTIAPRAIELLHSENRQLRRNAINILEKHPSPDALEPLWSRYATLLFREVDTRDDEAKRSKDTLFERMGLWPALKACVPLDPSWLEQKVCSNPPVRGELAGALVAFINALPDGRAYWLRLKDTLRQNIAGGGERHFANAIYHWRDDGENEWLLATLAADKGFVGACCLQAMIRTAPETAIEVFGNLPPEELSSTRAFTINLLWIMRPSEMLQHIRHLMTERPQATWDYAKTLSDIPNALDEATLDFLMDALFPMMDTNTAEDIWHEMRCVSGIGRLPLLSLFQQRAGTAWEERLTELLVERDPQPAGWRDVAHRDAVQVLFKTGGDGFTRMVNHWLANGDLYAKRKAMEEAFKRPNTETIRLLEKTALDLSDSQNQSKQTFDPQMAQLALARSSAWREAVASIVVWQKDSHTEALFARAGQQPLSNADMEPALAALQKELKHPGAIMALGFGQRTDYLDRIVAILDEESPDNNTDVSNACLWAMSTLPEVSPAAVRVIAKRLSHPEGRWLAVPLLVREGSPQAAEVLMQFLRDQLLTPLTKPYFVTIADDAVTAARFLLQNADTRLETVMLCRDRIGRDVEPDFIAQSLLQTLLEEEENIPEALVDKTTQEFLARGAFQQDGISYHVGEKARTIRGLAFFSPEDAYVAALRVLNTPESHDQERSPELLLRLDYERAVRDLIDYLTYEKHTHPRRTCARALCAAGAAEQIWSQYLTAEKPQQRAAACFVLGFAPPSADLEVAIHARLEDEDVHIFKTACAALRRLANTIYTNDLVEAYRAETDATRQWVILDAALDMGDVFNLTWLRHMLENAPYYVAEYVQEQVKSRQKKEIDDAKSKDWRDRLD